MVRPDDSHDNDHQTFIKIIDNTALLLQYCKIKSSTIIKYDLRCVSQVRCMFVRSSMTNYVLFMWICSGGHV